MARLAGFVTIAFRRGLDEQSRTFAVIEQMLTFNGTPSMPGELNALAVVAGNSVLYGRRELGLRVLGTLPAQLPEELGGRACGTALGARMFFAFTSDLSKALSYSRGALDALRRAFAVRDLATAVMNTGSRRPAPRL